MTREILSISLIKVFSVIFSFILPMVVARQYDLVEYGVFNYLTAMMVYVSIFQCGITPSLRNSLSKLSDVEDASETISFSIMQTISWVLLLVLVASLAFFYGEFDREYYVFILATIFTLFSPVVATYFDYKMESVAYKKGEFICQILVSSVVVFMCMIELHVALIASVMISYRTIYALYKCLSTKLLRIASQRLDVKAFFQYLHLGSGNSNYMLLQILSVASMILLTVYAESSLGIEEYGIYATYYKFFFFPVQIFAFAAPVIWMRYAQYKAGTQELTGVSYFFALLLFAILFWVVLMVAAADWFVRLYLGFEVDLEVSIFYLGLLYLSFQLSDFVSVFLNANGSFLIQTVFSAVTFSFLLFLFKSDIAFDSALLYFSFSKFLTVLFLVYYWRKS